MIISTINQTTTPKKKTNHYPALYMNNQYGHVVMFIDSRTGMILKRGSYVNGVGVTIYDVNSCTDEQKWRKLPPEEQIVLQNVD